MNKTILLVEDNASDEKLALLAFRHHGLADVVVRRDGAAALDYLLGGAALPAVVLLDLRLPRVDGFEVLRRFRADARTALLPVGVLTASREDEDVARSYALGANAYVRKPVDFTEFGETARAIGSFWLRVNETAPGRGGAP